MEKLSPPGFLGHADGTVSGAARPATWSPTAWEFGVVFVGLYLVLEWVSLTHPWGGTGVAPWNPQIAVVFAVVLMRGLGALPFVFVATLCSELLSRVDSPGVEVAVLCSALVAVGYTAGGCLLSRWLPERARIAGLRDLGSVLGIAVVAPLVVGSAYFGAHALPGSIDRDSYLPGVLSYWIGSVVGILTLLPLVAVLVDGERRRRLGALLRQWGALPPFGVALGVPLLVHVSLPGLSDECFLLLLLLLVWIAARHGFTGAAMAIAVIQPGLIGVVQASDSDVFTLLELQARMAGLAVTGLLLGVVVDQRERAQAQSRRSSQLSLSDHWVAVLARKIRQSPMALGARGRACRHVPAQTTGNALPHALESIDHPSPAGGEFLREADESGGAPTVIGATDSGSEIAAESRGRLCTSFFTSGSSATVAGLADGRSIATACGGGRSAEPIAYGLLHPSLPTDTGDLNDCQR